MRENEAIRRAIAAFAADASHDNLYAVLESIREMTECGGTVYVPADPAQPGRRAEARPDGTFAWVVYTDPEEAEKSGKSYSAADAKTFFLDVCGNRESTFSGVVINPEGMRIYLPAAMLQMTLAKQTVPENEIYFEIGDITELECDCIVNAANSSLLRGGGVCGAIFRAAGSELDEACDAIGGCPTGEARITGGFRLKASYIIHTVGPVYSGSSEDPKLLASCYRNSLNLAMENGIHSIAFPAISTGIYRYPLDEACEIALVTVSSWLAEHPDYGMAVIFSCFDERTYDAYDRCALRMEGKA